jgi:tetratricopeptide (TPR) repeat protein
LLLLGTSLLLAACASSGVGRPQAPVSVSQPAVIRAGQPATPAETIEAAAPEQATPRQELIVGPVRETVGPQAPEPGPPPARATPTTTLMNAVNDAVSAGDLEGAAAVAERALRISPRDAEMWLRLAEIRYSQGRLGEADGFARRASGFAGTDRELHQRIAELLLSVSNPRQ